MSEALSKAITESAKQPTLHQLAALSGKSYTTIQRWQRTNPWLFAALMEKAGRDSHNQLASPHSGR